MKLLFDQNLSPRLVRLLADIYPDPRHVRDVGLRDADDVAIWDYAGVHGYTIVSKDSDFPATKFTGWRPSQIHLVEGWQLYRREN